MQSQRRTQAERSASTRERVIQAVVDCIVEEGIQNTTAARIAKQSGVTWGAIAHQFGDKNSVFLAVVERNLELYSADLESAPSLKKLSPSQRVSVLVDRSWEHINQPSSLAFTEIVLYGRSHPNEELGAQREKLTAKLTKEVWDYYFGDLEIEPALLEKVRNLTSATMLGMSIQGMLGPHKHSFRNEIATLKETVSHLLSF